jgi:carboxymethylenebutenolidase
METKLHSEMIEFATADGTANAYLVKSEGEAKRPGLIVIQEWWGLNDHIKDVAGRFAAQGYVVVAPDLYDGVVTKDAEEAGKLMQGLAKEKALGYLNGAVEYLKQRPDVKPEAIGVTGFCMGGSYSLLLACHNPQIKAAAPFYGDVPSDAELENLSAPVLFIGAENDPWITQDKMNHLADALKKFYKQGKVKVYPGVGHAFFNNTRPEAYNENAAKDAWAMVNAFLAQKLQS